jgi:hypothetical protein
VAFIADGRLRYVRSAVAAKGAALNQGLELTTGDLVVCTDDDCEAPAGWVTAMAMTLAAHERVAVAFCNVIAPSYDRGAGYVPAYERTIDRTLTSVFQVRHDGFRTFAEGREHAYRDWVGIGAVFAKPLRAGYVSVAIPAVYQFGVYAVWPPVGALLRGRKPGGWSRVARFVRGFVAGLSTRVDRRTISFTPALARASRMQDS